MNNTTGLIFAIERCSLHDGPGIRTTVFLKGCPLHCVWCHNPESIAARPELYSLHERCTRCGACEAACPHGCHEVTDNGHTIARDECVACGMCVEACPAGALEIKGHTMSVAEVVAEVVRDRDYYAESGGGMTLSGGEPMAQYEFSRALLAAAGEQGIHTCIETSAYAPRDRLLEVVSLVSLFLIDWKDTDSARHREWTGVPNERIRENIRALDAAGAPILLRCPIVPDCNARPDHFQGIAALANELTHVAGIDVMPYHPMGRSKSARIGKEYGLPASDFTDEDTAERWRELIRRETGVTVR